MAKERELRREWSFERFTGLAWSAAEQTHESRRRYAPRHVLQAVQRSEVHVRRLSSDFPV